MNHFGKILGIAALSCAASLTFAQPTTAGCTMMTSKPDIQGVTAAANGFYAALNQMFTGDLTAMNAIWSHADDVTYMGPGGGFQKGWPAVQAEFQKQADMKLGGKVDGEEMLITAGSDVAIVSDYERGKNTNADGKVSAVSLRATSIFRLENGVWKMIGHHTDTLPYLKQ
ncbi:MAG TPA: nuclear transport factor 2 family protein [Rhizomicrobium sp.]|nr:nuclear transport factor 2 family protein [Rhizomicrobium sp.]